MLYYEAQPKALPEGIESDDSIIATYYAALPRDMIMYYPAPFLAVEQSTGTWTAVPGETPEVRAKHVAKVIAIHEVPFFEFEVPQRGGWAHLRGAGRLPRAQHRAPDTHAAHRRGGIYFHEGQDQAHRPLVSRVLHRWFRRAQVWHRRHL